MSHFQYIKTIFLCSQWWQSTFISLIYNCESFSILFNKIYFLVTFKIIMNSWFGNSMSFLGVCHTMGFTVVLSMIVPLWQIQNVFLYEGFISFSKTTTPLLPWKGVMGIWEIVSLDWSILRVEQRTEHNCASFLPFTKPVVLSPDICIFCV